MPAITPLTPLEASEMFQRTRTQSIFDVRSLTQSKPTWYSQQEPDAADTDFEDESEYEGSSPKNSFDSVSHDSDECYLHSSQSLTTYQDDRRRSQTTISSYEEAPTPSPRNSELGQFDFGFRPVQGPKGPHLFRSSQSSSELDFDDRFLQMSPMLPKASPVRTATAFSEQTVIPPNLFPRTDEARSPGAMVRDAEAQIRSWSTQEVIDWMYQSGIDPSVMEAFEVHDINGAILLDLQFDHLKELDIQSFGKRHQLWEAICLLRGEDRPSPQQTPFQDISRPCTTIPDRSRPQWSALDKDRARSVTPGGNKRRGRKPPKATKDIVTPAESVSIVAIEQLIPKLHRCGKGEKCPKWRKQQRQLELLRNDDGYVGFPISPEKGGHILVAGDPGNAQTAENLLPHCHKLSDVQQPAVEQEVYQPTSEAIPSLVASSDLLGPGQLPAFSLQEEALGNIAWRDPQDNVKQFLNFQHMNSPVAPDRPRTLVERPPSPLLEMFPAASVSPFPAQYQDGQIIPPPPPHVQLKSLPKLQIPRSASADPNSCDLTPVAAGRMCRSATMSPSGIVRLATPASEMDVPVTAIPLGPVARDTSQSVPPNMHYNQQSNRTHSRVGGPDWRRPSMQLPAVQEGIVLSPETTNTPRPSPSKTSGDARVSVRVQDPSKDAPNTQHFGYGSDCTHAGWVRKRKTKMLRHEWVESHSRLKGTQLTLHPNARFSTMATDTIDVDKYAVACNSVASSSKLGAAMKALSLKNANGGSSDTKGKTDPTAFAFQLVPNASGSERRRSTIGSSGKTHHFAVKTKDERIDWMREIMLAKALQQKGKGYEVEVNGVQA